MGFSTSSPLLPPPPLDIRSEARRLGMCHVSFFPRARYVSPRDLVPPALCT